MGKLKIAVLEDSRVFLKELVSNLKLTELVDVIVYEETSEPFMDKVRDKNPEALLLDIHLTGESINGVQIAEILQLPVLFLSAERKNHLDGIDKLKLLGTFPVEDIGKTPDKDKLKTILRSFIPRVKEYQKTQKVPIKPKGEEEILISPSDVSFIESLKGTGNHKINFIDRKPKIVADKTFEYFKNNGFSTEKFYLLDRAYLVNISIAVINDDMVEIKFTNDKGMTEIRNLNIPEDKKREVKKLLMK